MASTLQIVVYIISILYITNTNTNTNTKANSNKKGSKEVCFEFIKQNF